MINRLYIQRAAKGLFYLRDSNGVWVGPGLGEFRSPQAARQWAKRQPAWCGYRVAREFWKA